MWRRKNACNTIRLYKDTMREDAMEFANPLVHAPTLQESRSLSIFSAYSADHMDKFARIYERAAALRKRKSYHRSVRKFRACVSRASSSKVNNSNWRILSLDIYPIDTLWLIQRLMNMCLCLYTVVTYKFSRCLHVSYSARSKWRSSSHEWGISLALSLFASYLCILNIWFKNIPYMIRASAQDSDE